MITKEHAMFILAFCLAGGIINSTGIFSPVSVPNAGAENITTNMSDELLNVDPGDIQSATDVSTTLDSWGLLLNTYAMVKQMLHVIVLPYYFLVSIGVNSAFAGAVQVILNAAMAWSLIQFIMNRSFKQIE